MNLNLCRLCYDNEGSIHIFLTSDTQILSKIKQCCGTVKITESDGLPLSICYTCELELNASYKFILKCQTTEKQLRSLLLLESSLDNNLKYVCSLKSEVKTEVNGNDDVYDADNSLVCNISDLKQDITNVENKQEQHLLNVKDAKKSNKKRLKLNHNNLVCSVCSRKCLNSSALAIHMRTHTNERPFQCTSCDKTYKDRGTLKRHIERNHVQKRERKFICENCGKGFYSKSDILTHMRVHTGETPYTCPICSVRFTQLSAMLRHKRRHTDKKSHICSTCGKPFWTKEELKKHFSVHEDTRQFSCPVCNVQFKHKGSIQKHMRIHSEPNRFVCSHCGKTFNNKGNLKSHVSRKHSEKSGCCNICSKNVSNIEVHMWRHTGQRPLKCEFCVRSFYEIRALALHINFKHKKTDKFKCTAEGCTKSFPSKPMLMFHIAKFHENQTPYPCEKCPRGFYRKNDLARHMLGTHKERLL